MGLPMYTVPDDVVAKEAAAKLDRAAAQQRSTIRRERSVRPGRDQSAAAGLANVIRRRQQSEIILRARRRVNEQSMETEHQIANLEEELDRLREQRLRNRSRFLREIEQSMSREQPELSSAISPTESQSSNIENTSDPTLSVAPTESIALPHPSRNSNLRFSVAATASERPGSSWRTSARIPTPPMSADDHVPDRSIPDGPLEPWSTSAPLTMDFAPARAGRSSADADRPDSDMYEAERLREMQTPPPENWESSYPPLRRVRHMSPRPLPRSTIDGLGDRRRSPSPHSESHEEDWTTLLTAMDTAAAPSTTTSFASTTDLASSRNYSQRSMTTLNTSTSFGEIGSSAEETCDLPPGITEADVRHIRDLHRPRRVREAYRNESRTRALVRLLERSAFSSDDARTPRDSRSSDNSSDQRLALEPFHAILDHLEMREPVPDELWSMAGLPTDFGRMNHIDS